MKSSKVVVVAEVLQQILLVAEHDDFSAFADVRRLHVEAVHTVAGVTGARRGTRRQTVALTWQ